MRTSKRTLVVRPGEMLMRLSMVLTILVAGLLAAAPIAHAGPIGTVTLTQTVTGVDVLVSLVLGLAGLGFSRPA